MRIGLGIALVMTLAPLALADPVIVFNSTALNGHSGVIHYDPTNAFGFGSTGNTVVGTGIDIDSLSGIGTKAHDGYTTMCWGCTLSFQTGAVLNDTSANGTNWSFLGGGYFNVYGGFDLNGNGSYDAGIDIAPGTLLLSGIFKSPVNISTPSIADIKFASATLITNINNSVDGYFGAPGTTVYNGSYTQSFDSKRSRFSQIATNPNYNRWRFDTWRVGGVPTGMKDGAVTNTYVVPEPLSLLTFGTVGGILGLCAYRRRKLV